MEFDASPPIAPDATRPTTDRVRVFIFWYLVYVVLSFVVEGLGRASCRVPKHLLAYCLETSWYYYADLGLLLAALIAPIALVWLLKERIMARALDMPFLGIKVAALLFMAVYLLGLVVAIAPHEACSWFYELYG